MNVDPRLRHFKSSKNHKWVIGKDDIPRLIDLRDSNITTLKLFFVSKLLTTAFAIAGFFVDSTEGYVTPGAHRLGVKFRINHQSHGCIIMLQPTKREVP